MVITIRVIIAEKPSLARNIASSIGNMKRADGYMIGNEYIMDSTNHWNCGNDFAPILALNMLAKNDSNNCKCSVCKFYSEYK